MIEETKAEFKVLNLRINELEGENELLLQRLLKLDNVLEKAELFASLIKDVHTGTYEHFQEFFDDVKSEKMLITPTDSDEEDDDFEPYSISQKESSLSSLRRRLVHKMLGSMVPRITPERQDRIVMTYKKACYLLKKGVRNPVNTVFEVVDICMYRHPFRTLSVVAATVGYAGTHIGLILLKEYLEGDL